MKSYKDSEIDFLQTRAVISTFVGSRLNDQLDCRYSRTGFLVSLEPWVFHAI